MSCRSFAPTNTLSPTVLGYRNPSFSPTRAPTTKTPTGFPTQNPNFKSVAPTATPTLSPTQFPTCSPTFIPTALPTFVPTSYPTFGKMEHFQTTIFDHKILLQINKSMNRLINLTTTSLSLPLLLVLSSYHRDTHTIPHI